MSDTSSGGDGNGDGGAVHRGTDTVVGDSKVIPDKGPEPDAVHRGHGHGHGHGGGAPAG